MLYCFHRNDLQGYVKKYVKFLFCAPKLNFPTLIVSKINHRLYGRCWALSGR